ncbi:hypothetical protein B0T22DRAFT_164000 [Podospora appendiculata]|uniref:SET domain-containing protein n=1 Tax=Podospora appendiculata TaxID=314037 RepID=A0AAE1CCR7_9PEZI|nr:hypothetical protein B0T22DRAFT_164000 [Podospora appendiculata]
MNSRDQKRFDELVSWAEENGASLHPSLEVYLDDVTKYSVRVKPSAQQDDFLPGSTAIACPVSTTLSFLNAVAGGPITVSASPNGHREPAFPLRFMNEVPPYVIGRFFLVQQYLKGNNSFWRPYIATLPQPEHISSWALPAFWPEDDVDFLENTNVAVAAEEIQANVKKEFKQARNILKEENFPNWQDYTRVLYNWAFCIFTSRSFRPSLILTQPARDHVSGILPTGCKIDDFSILQPLFDIPNHSMTAKYTWDVVSDPACCRLICGDAYRPGEQIYNNYGLKTNSELLLGYGFILPETKDLHNDYYHVRKINQTTDDSESPNKPKDFLISLRPISDPSSLVGRARQVDCRTLDLHKDAAFAHIEPALVYDLAMALAKSQEKAYLDAALGVGIPPGDTLPNPGLEQLSNCIKEVLVVKMVNDFQRLADFEVFEMEEEQGQFASEAQMTPNQKLAMQYREQCTKALEAALTTLTDH